MGTRKRRTRAHKNPEPQAAVAGPQVPRFQKHAMVAYRAPDGTDHVACVLAVHVDDATPYYTIRVFEGPYAGERQTVEDRLRDAAQAGIGRG